MPALRRWVTMSQGAASAAPVVVDAMTVEVLRAPNFAPDQMTVFQIVRGGGRRERERERRRTR